MRWYLYVIGMICGVLLGSSSAVAIDLKVDRVTVNSTIGAPLPTWIPVTFVTPYDSVPVVVVLTNSENEDAATVRIRNVSTTGFEMALIEVPGSDSVTTEMTVDYLAAEVGDYNFPGSVRLSVRTLSTTAQFGAGFNTWETVTFRNNWFSATPAVVAQVQTINSQPDLEMGVAGDPWLDVAIDNVTTDSMRIALDRAKNRTGTVVPEVVGYIAMESDTGFFLDGQVVTAFLTPRNIQGWDDNPGCFYNSYFIPFFNPPKVVASKNTSNGADGGWIRECDVSPNQVGLVMDEEPDRSHGSPEVAGVIAFSDAFFGERNGNQIGGGSATIPPYASESSWTRVDFPNAFPDTPVIFTLPTAEGSPPASTRVRNVTTTGFDVAAFQPPGSNPPHPEMTIDYIAIRQGIHETAAGDVFEVGVQSINRFSSTSTRAWVPFRFTTDFVATPAMLADIQSTNNEPTLDPNSVSSSWMTASVRALNRRGAWLTLDRAQTGSGSLTFPEDVAYFAVLNGSNGFLSATDGRVIDYEMLISSNNVAGWENICRDVSFAESYTTPYAVAAMNTRAGGDGGWIRRCDLQSSSIGLTVDEDTTFDSERIHTNETASVFVFSEPFEAFFTTVGHYAVLHSGSGVTCEPEAVTVVAHDVNHAPFAGETTVTITATSSTPGWSPANSTWSLNSGIAGRFSTSGNRATYTFDSGETGVVLNLATTVPADIDIDVRDENGLTDIDGGAEDGILAFANTGLRFYADADGDQNADGTSPVTRSLVAGSASVPMVLRAVETDTQTGACLARVSGPQTVSLAYECDDPNRCALSAGGSVNGSTIQGNDRGNVTNFGAVSLAFDTQGEAPLSFTYDDVGQVALHAQLALPANGASPAQVIEGVSGPMVARPADLVVASVQDSAGNANPGTTTMGAGFLVAGEAFTVTVQSLNSKGIITPNFGNESAPENVAVSMGNLVLPVGGNLPGLTTMGTFSPTTTAGEFEHDAIRWPEVGTITVVPSVADGDYLGEGNVTGSESFNIGRFYPAHYQLTSSMTENGCAAGGFTYLSDTAFTHSPIDMEYTIEAHNQGGSITENYDESLGYPVGGFSIVAENSDGGVDLQSRALMPLASWATGAWTVTGDNNAGFRRANNGVEEGPFNAVQFGLMPDGVSPDNVDFLSADRNMDPTSSGNCGASCTAMAIGSPINARFGRLLTEDVHGPESADLAGIYHIEFWNGTQFVVNTDDDCTALNRADIQFGGTAITTTPTTVTVGGGISTGSFNTDSGNSILQIQSGDSNLLFSAVSPLSSGSFDVVTNMSNYPWLQYDWNQNGDSTDDAARPVSTVTFGSYRGNDRVIYWRERMD
ncbi:H-type lectin domain-containing protein [Marinibactrum halimedae]|uniref:DUF6701 domain-containing protein n=1 Tax=Marinibactrum halimedae TaxID=1444977 RepID=A0AA37T0D5_9GAMM|nr:H-type lectin domain-containing protein [Marinibactrum halimedae]MCD9461274.1 H-type lectin domain-containing protein [Marinibactrum halimedae]GLS24629.1 hypothetical protein GCM10007877_03430 [Marinibactrum halimedae]